MQLKKTIITVSILIVFFIGLFIIINYRHNIVGMFKPLKPIESIGPKKPVYKYYNINIEDDKDKLGKVHSRLIWFGLINQYPRTSGVSENVGRIKFNHNVEIIGFIVSIDHSSYANSLVEVAATVNTKWGYYAGSKQDAIIHTSFEAHPSHRGVRKTDEQIMFTPGYGISLKKGDVISVGTYIKNEASIKYDVSPEYVIFYRWLK